MQEEKQEAELILPLEISERKPDFVVFWETEVQCILKEDEKAIRASKFNVLKAELECEKELIETLIKETDSLRSKYVSS